MHKSKENVIAVIIICAAVFLVYLNCLPNNFMFDDNHMIVKNNYIKQFKYVPLFFKGEITSEPIVKGMYRPLLMMTYSLDYFFSGLKPYGYHIINILIHFLNACLLYFFLKLFFNKLSFWVRLGLTLLFCVHPINTETVLYISSRSDLLCSFFMLSSFFAYIISFKDKQRVFLYLASVGLYSLALFTKEIALAMVGLICAYEFIYSSPKSWRKIVPRVLPFILIAFGYLLLRRSVFGGMLAVKDVTLFIRPFSANILIQSAVSFYYIYLFFFPFNICIDHFFPVISGFSNPLYTGSLIAVLILIVFSLSAKKRVPAVVRFSCLWYFISLSPKFYARLNFISAEHQAYFAYFSLYFIIAFILSKISVKKVYLRMVFIFIFSLFCLLTFIRTFQWRNEYMLWQATVKVNPRSSLAHAGLGKFFLEKGVFEQAKTHLLVAAESNIESIRITSLVNLAGLYALEGNPEKGLDILNANNGYLFKKHVIGYHKALGVIYLKMGKKEEARKVWERAIKIHPKNAVVKSMVGWWYMDNLSDKNKAREYFEAALRDNPDSALTHFGLGQSLEDRDVNRALGEYHKAIKLAPDMWEVHYRLGTIYAKELLDTRAEYYFKKAIELNPQFAPAYYNLSIFYLSLAQPDYSQSRKYFNKARELGYIIDEEIEQILDNN